MSGSYFYYGSGTWSMSYLVTGGWAYAPMGDVYPLNPLWEESHALTGSTIFPEDEQNRYSLAAAYEGTDPFLVLQVTEDNPETEEIEEDVPEGVAHFVSRLWKPFGWGEEYQIGVDLLTTDPPEEAWTGKFKLTFPDVVRKLVGPGCLAHFSFDFWMDEDPDRVRLAYGDVVFRR